MRFILLILLLGSHLLNGATVEQMKKESRHALVIANSVDQGVPEDTNVRSAKKMEVFLHQKGFQVVAAYDQDREALIKTYRKFDRQLPSNGVIAVVYSGCIIAHDGRSWIVPPGMDMDDIAQLKRTAVSLDFLVEKLQRHSPRVTLAFIDGYHFTLINNSTEKRSLLRAFSDIKQTDTFVEYNQGAKPWMFAFVKRRVGERKESVEALARKLRSNGVRTHIAQQEFYFNVPDKIISPEDAAWQQARTAHSVQGYASFVSAFPKSKYISEAKGRIETIREEAARKLMMVEESNVAAENNISIEKNTTDILMLKSVETNSTKDLEIPAQKEPELL